MLNVAVVKAADKSCSCLLGRDVERKLLYQLNHSAQAAKDSVATKLWVSHC